MLYIIYALCFLLNALITYFLYGVCIKTAVPFVSLFVGFCLGYGITEQIKNDPEYLKMAVGVGLGIITCAIGTMFNR